MLNSRGRDGGAGVLHEDGFIAVLEDCCDFSPLGNRCSKMRIKIRQLSVKRHGFFVVVNYL